MGRTAGRIGQALASRAKRAGVIFMAFLAITWGLPVAGSLTAPVVAHAAPSPDADVLAIASGLQSFCDFTKGLASDGTLGQPLPLLNNLVPGSDSGFGFSDLCQDSVMAQVHSALTASPNPLLNCNQLASFLTTSNLSSLTNSRTGSLTVPAANVVCGSKAVGSTAGTPDVIPLDLQVNRTVTNAGLNIGGSGSPVAITSTSGVTVMLHVELSVTFGYDWDKNFFYVVDNSTTKPTLSATAAISVASAAQFSASIGILDAMATANTAVTGNVTFSATMSDPTGTGQLGFSLGNGGAGNTALATAQIGSIFNASFAGSVCGTACMMTVAPNDIGGFKFPSGTSASFDFSWPDITNPSSLSFTNVINFNNLLDDFETLSTSDLADGLGHLVQALRSVEAAKTGLNLNVNLPFMQGSLADITKVEESLAQFLTDNVKTTPNPQQGGADAPYETPSFNSLQDLVSKINVYKPTGSAAGSTIGVSNVNFEPDSTDNPPKPKLALTLSLGRASGGPSMNVDPGVKPADSGSTSTYTATTLTDGTKSWTTNEWQGFQLRTTDGLHSAAITGNTATQLTFSGGWIGGTPTGSISYQITGKDPKTGLVNFGNISQGGSTFFLNANATIPQATVTPSYQASVTLVLDLEPPVTGSACSTYLYNSIENPSNQSCPFVASGGMVVNSLPTVPDRFMLRTADSSGNPLTPGLFTFDAPIDTHVSIDAQAGFLGIHLDGDLKECTANSKPDCSGTTVSGEHLLSVNLKPQLVPTTTSDYDIPLSELFSDLTKSGGGPSSVLSASVNGQAYAGLTVTVPQAAAFFGGNASASTSITMADITAPTNISVDASQLSQLADFNFDPKNPQALFGAIVKGLQVVLQMLQNTSGAAKTANSQLNQALNTTIPVVNRSLKDVLASSEGGQGSSQVAAAADCPSTSTSVAGSTTVLCPVHYDTTTLNSNTVGQITDVGKSWQTNQFSGRQVVVGTQMMTIDHNDATHLVLTANWSGGAPSDGTQYMMNNELESVLTALTANPAPSLQDVVDVLNKLLNNKSPVTFTVDTSQTVPLLKLSLDWAPTYATSVPLGLDLSPLGSGLSSIVGLKTGGTATLTANAELKLNVMLPLTDDPTTSSPCYLGTNSDPSSLLDTLCIGTDSEVKAGVSLSAKGFVEANLGPVAVALGDPADSTKSAQANAALSVGITDPSPTASIESIGNFLTEVKPSFDDGSAVTCNDPANPTSDKLAVCGVLPLYVQSGSSWKPVCTGSGCSPDEIFLRLPQSSDPTDTFNLSGFLSDGTTPRFGTNPDATTIAGDLASQILDLSALNGGIDGYFQFAENALNLASDNGQLPLVGHDLQQGSQFLTKLQSTIDSTFGSLGSAGNVNDIENFAKTTLTNALNSASFLPSGAVTPTLTCSSSGTLSSPTPTLNATNPDNGTTNYTYELVAKTSDGSAAASGPSSTKQNVDPSKLGSTDYNSLTWTAESNVTYQVYRDTGSGYQLVADNLTFNGTTGTFKDTVVTPISSTGPPAGTNPCDPNTTLASNNITGVTLDVSVGQGTPDPSKGCTGTGCLGTGLGTAFDIGVPGLSLSAAGGPGANLLNVTLGWGLHLKFGIDKDRGFFVCTGEVASGATPCANGTAYKPIAVGVGLSLPASMKLNIAFLQMCVADHGTTMKNGVADPCSGTQTNTPEFAGEFDVALTSPHHDGTITASDLASADLTDLVTPELTAKVNIDWDFLVDANAPNAQALPGLGGEFQFIWSWTSPGQTPGSGTPTISFNNVYLDVGTFLSGALQPIVDQVKQVLDPIRPIINVLEAPIPVLSDLSEAVGGPPVTLLSIAEAFNTLASGPSLAAIDEVVQTLQFVTNLVNEISSLSGQTIHIPLGSFSVLGNSAKDTTATPDNADQLIDSSSVQSCDSTAGTLPSQCIPTNKGTPTTTTPTSTFDGLNGNSNNVLNSGGTGKSGDNSCGPTNTDACGFQFTALQHPSSLLSLLMGKDVELFAFDSGPLTLGFTYNQSFGPVYAPPPVLVVISGSASVTARVRIGFDTKGIRDAVQAAESGGGAGGTISGILDGLYISTTDSSGQPIPAITVTGTLAAGAEVSVVLISVGIEGGITLTINLLWNDPDNDGKLRFSEFLAGLSNPLCLFNFSGSLSAFIEVFIDIGVSPFDVSFSFNLVNVTLLDFSANTSCAKSSKPPLLGGVSGGVLYVYAGNLGSGKFRDQVSGDHWGNDQNYNADEKFLVTELHDPNNNGAYKGMSIDWQGHHQEFDDTSIKTVEVDARNYAHNETITMTGDGNQATGTPAFDKGAVVFGGSKNNAIKIDDACPLATPPTSTSCTLGKVFIDGNTGGDHTANNQINVGDAQAFVAGGPGGNQIQVGNGDDWVAGNSALGFNTLTYKDTSNQNTAAYNQTQSGIVDPTSITNPTTWSADHSGLDGNDTIHVGFGLNTVWGGIGGNNISVAKDLPLSTLLNSNPKFCNTGGLCVSKGDTIVGGGGGNHITSGSGPDTIWAGQYAPFGGFGSWTGVSTDGFNSVDTGPGNKTVYAGGNGDSIVGHSVAGTVDTFYGGQKDDELIGGDGNDKLYGGAGNDVIIAGTGSNFIEGLSGNNYIVAGVPGSNKNSAVTPAACPSSSDGCTVAGVDGHGIPQRTVTPPPSTTVDGQNTIIGGSGSNHIWGGNAGDTIYGHQQVETCAPPLPGHAPWDVQYDPTKEAPSEATQFNWIYGGIGGDTISGGGGTNYINTGPGNDVACAGSGNDTVIGGSLPNQMDRIYGIAGRNLIYGGSGRDILIGGTDDDTIYAGSGNTYVEGGGGANTIYAGGGNDAIIGGYSTAGKTHQPDSLPNPPNPPRGGRLFGGQGVAVIVGDNGCVDMTANGPEVSFPGNPVTVNSCNPAGSPNPIQRADGSSGALQVFDLDSANPTLGENNYIVGGTGPGMMFGGLGSNTIFGGASDNYIEGGTGNNYIEGHGGHNDIMGGSSPSYLPEPTCGQSPGITSCIPAGANIIYGDDGTGGVASGTIDGSNAIIGDNGQITRAGVFPGWQGSALTSAPVNCDTTSCSNAPNIVWGDGSTLPNRTITDLDIYNGDLQGSGAWIFGGTADDFLFGGPGGNHIYGGPPQVKGVFDPAKTTIDPNGSFGNDYMEGGPGFNYLYSGGGQNDMIGGVSPFHLAAGKHTSDVANLGSYQLGGNGDNYMVADNGEIDHECGPPGSPTVAACTTPSTPWTVDPNDGAYFRSVTLHDLLTIGGDSTLITGNGFDHAYGGKGNDKLTGGAHDDYLMGGPGDNTINGGTGSNDIIGGTAPEVLEAGLTTAGIPSGHNLIYTDGGAASPTEGASVAVGNNGDITRKHDTNGIWIVSNNDPADLGVVQRATTNLDIYGYPLASGTVTPDLQGGSDVIFGGTRDDILLGGPAGNAIYAGPPSGTGAITTVTSQFFDNTKNYGNKHIEGGPGSNTVYGSGGDDDIIGGVSPFYLQAGHDTGTVGYLDTPNHTGNLLVGGTGNDYIAGDNAQVDHLCGPDLHVCSPVDTAQWAFNVNDSASIRQIQLLNLDTASGPTGSITHGIGGDNRIYGTGGDNHLYGENANNFIQGGWGDDYIEGGTGNNLLQGGGGDKDIVGGTSPQSVNPGSPGAVSDAYVANRIPSGNNIICSFVCGRLMPVGSTTDPLVHGDTSNDSVIVGHNGRIDRCAAVVSGGVGTPQGSDRCQWQRTPYGNEKVSSHFDTANSTGVAQTGQVCTAVGPGCPVVGLGNPRTRFTTLLGQSPTETIQAGTDYIEGNVGNDQMYGEDGPAVIHSGTPRQDASGAIPSTWFPQYAEYGGSFLLSNECLPNPSDTSSSQDIIVGGYGGVGLGRNLQDLQSGFGSNDVLCGGNGDDAIVGNRGLVGTLHPSSTTDPLSGAVTPVPFSNAGGGPNTIGATGGPPYGTLAVPGSGNTIYPVRLDVEYVDGVLQPVPNWNNPAATGQTNQHDIIFGEGGNNTIHGSPGADFIEGGYGMHIAGTPTPCAAVPPSPPGPTAPPSPCTPTGDNIIYGGQGQGSIEGGPGNADIFGGPGNKDLNVKRSDTSTAPKVDNAGNCLPLAFPTITLAPSLLGTANGYCGLNPSFPNYQWANQSYASRFPAPTGQAYDYDPAGRDNGGTDAHTPVFGHVVISGVNRDIDQAQGFGDRMIAPNGAFNLFYVCPAAYGGSQIIRAFKPGLLMFMHQLASLDGAYNINQTDKPPATPSSGDTEVGFVYPTSGNTGSAYPTTAGHFTC